MNIGDDQSYTLYDKVGDSWHQGITWNWWKIWIWTTTPTAQLDVNWDFISRSSNWWYVALNPGDWALEIWSWNDSYSFLDFKWNSTLSSDFDGRIWYSDTNKVFDFNRDINSAWNIKATWFIYQSSDRRLKKNITLLKWSALDKLTSLNWYTFDWKKNWVHDIWVIAQEVEKVYPRLVITDDKWMKAVKYSNFISPVIEALKEVKNKIQFLFEKYLDQQNQIDDLKNQNNNLEKRIEKLEKMILENK